MSCRIKQGQLDFGKSEIQILFCKHFGGREEEWNLRIALINFLKMWFISNFDTSFTHECNCNPKEEDSSFKIQGFMATYIYSKPKMGMAGVKRAWEHKIVWQI